MKKSFTVLVALFACCLSPVSVFASESVIPSDVEQQYYQMNWNQYDDSQRKMLNQMLIHDLSEEFGVAVPEIQYFSDSMDDAYYNYEKNVLAINEDKLESAQDMYLSIYHEMRHAWQYERTRNPQTQEDWMFKYNFENYVSVSGDHGYDEYSQQYIEIDAGNYAGMSYMNLIQYVLDHGI